MTSTGKPAYLSRLRIRGMSLEALTWAKAQAVAERKSVGNLLSELMYEYRNDVSRSRDSLPRAPYRDYSHEAIAIRGISVEVAQGPRQVGENNCGAAPLRADCPARGSGEGNGNVSPNYTNPCSNPDTNQPTNSRIMNRDPEV